VTALGAVKQTRARGVSEVHPHVPLLDIFSNHVLPQLQHMNTSDPTSLLLTAGALKFIATFRNQIPISLMQPLLPLVMQCLQYQDQFVVHSYAAFCIEKLLTVKDGVAPTSHSSGTSSARTSHTLSGPAAAQLQQQPQRRITKSILQPYLHPLLTQSFSLLDAASIENDYVMRLVLRLFVVAQELIVPYADTCVQQLTRLLQKVCANPSNPAFSHCLFEAISSLIAQVAAHATSSTFIDTFEQLLFPPFQQVRYPVFCSIYIYIYIYIYTYDGCGCNHVSI
jgi:exportin-2 (importin alpha re-exporter)